MVQENQYVYFRALGTTYRVLSSSIDGACAIVEHTLEANSIGAPMHKHTNENEISYILEGELTVIQNGIVQTAWPGEYVIKPKGIFHTFWNSSGRRIKFIEIISPGNFENYYAEIAPYLLPGAPPQLDKLAETAARYGLVIDMEATLEIIKKYGLRPLS